jgi:hypothetical protein
MLASRTCNIGELRQRLKEGAVLFTYLSWPAHAEQSGVLRHVGKTCGRKQIYIVLEQAIVIVVSAVQCFRGYDSTDVVLG